MFSGMGVALLVLHLALLLFIRKLALAKSAQECLASKVWVYSCFQTKGGASGAAIGDEMKSSSVLSPLAVSFNCTSLGWEKRSLCV